MSTKAKNDAIDDGGEDQPAGGGERKKKGKGKSIAITCNLPDIIDDDAANVIREDLGAEVEKFLRQRLGKNVRDLIVH